MRTPLDRTRPARIAFALLAVAALAAPALAAEPTARARDAHHAACPEATVEPRCPGERTHAATPPCDCSCEAPEASDTRRPRLPPVSF